MIDTNVFVSGLIAGSGINYELIVRFYQRAFTLLLSAELKAEYEEVLAREELLKKYPRLAVERQSIW